jgi:isopentenyl diphosphate isomerase/L-lactate dehydrogenase-like FMN-dependent dehydrogenase
LLQALVSKGLLTPDEGIDVVDMSLDAVLYTPHDEEVQEAAVVASACLEHVRKGLEADLPSQQ